MLGLNDARRARRQRDAEQADAQHERLAPPATGPGEHLGHVDDQRAGHGLDADAGEDPQHPERGQSGGQ